MERRVIIIAGPTASGKTSFSLYLAEKLKTEIISADSRQVYKRLNIGTAKPTAEELNRVNHHLVDFLEPDEVYNASLFENDALQIIKNLMQENKIPIVAGGTGLYIKALVDGIFNSVDTDPEYRDYLHNIKEAEGNEALYELLKNVDPEAAGKMLPQNWKRVMRALEVYHISGKTIGEHQKKHRRELPFNFFQFVLYDDRDKLYERIEKRVDRMIDEGLVEEVRKILDIGYSPELNGLNTVGYKEIIDYIKGEYSLERGIELIKRNTRRYAKRQLTWFRGDDRIKWIKYTGEQDNQKAAEEILQTIRVI